MNTRNNGHISQLSRNVFACLVGGFLLASVGALSGCVQSASSDGGSGEAGGIVSVSSGLYADFSFDEFCKNSDLICSGTFVGKSDSFLVEPINGAEPRYFTDYYFKVSQKYLGSLPASAAKDDGSTVVAVRQAGGSSGDVTSVNDTAVNPLDGQEYLLFLYKIIGGGDYNTEGDQYYLISSGFGAWPLNSEGVYEKPSGTASVAKSQVQAQVDSAVPAYDEGVEKEPYYAQYLREIEQLYQEGQISKDYYDKVMKQWENADTNYSRIMSAEEQAAYEANILS